MFSLEALFCPVDDFCHQFEEHWQQKLLHHGVIKRVRAKSLCLSEIMTILIAFHQNHYRNFQHFYLNHVQQQWGDAFPGLPSYQRFIEWMPSTLLPLCVYLKAKPRRNLKNKLMRLQDKFLLRVPMRF
ncbi:hypothetical protein MiTs_01233 [Microcystis aeruginosa NIES-2521]|uniref:Transposase DDE domain-containing protein n=1 Tax=Microcystis aeruginosa NIES-2521 TaxID=2303983 RepID=A0A5A5RRR7_MICAE|nr:hypothetical protein [Microcystis aeruginosa]GCA79244.1 hypothetical protein MiTs_01233 [Microcystis aeruginosa NIES-2521]